MARFWLKLLLLASASNLGVSAAPQASQPQCQTGQLGTVVNRLKFFRDEVDRFCSLVVKPSTVTVSTVIRTAKGTTTQTVATVTSVTTRTRSVRGTTTSYDPLQEYTLTEFTLTGTTTVTASYTVIVYTTTPSIVARAVGPSTEGARGASLVLDGQGGALGYAASIISSACSCLVTPASTTATLTTTIGSTVKVTATAKTTITETQYAETISFYTGTTTTSPYAVTQGVVITYTTTRTGSVCDGPDPTFKMRIEDTVATQTDQYNGQYATVSAYPDFFNRMNLTSDPQKAALFSLTSNGTLTSGLGGIAAITYFLDIDLPAFMTAQEISQRQFFALQCNITSGLMTCLGPSYFQLDEFQTCPLYQEYYGTPVCLGSEVFRDGPVCQGFKWRILPICTPRR